MKKSYQIEVPATAENIAALQNANVDFTLFEVNTVKQGRSDFANRANFDFKEVILKSVTEMDDSDYTDQQLKNYCAGLQRELYGKAMEKIVKL